MRLQFVKTLGLAAVLAGGFGWAGGAVAAEIGTGGKLLLTGGVSSLEGGAGGGLATWAVIAGNETNNADPGAHLACPA